MPELFDEMTRDDCPAACSVDGCVISGKPYCAHPMKGGLQHVSLQDAAALNRLKQARKLLGIGLGPEPVTGAMP